MRLGELTPDRELFVYRDVHVDLSTGVILDRTGLPIAELLYEKLYWVPDPGAPAKGQVRQIRREVLGDPELLRTEVSLRRAAYNNFYRAGQSDFESKVLPSPHSEMVYALSPFVHGAAGGHETYYVFGHLYDSLMRLEPVQRSAFRELPVLLSDGSQILDFDAHLAAVGVGGSQVGRVKSVDNGSIIHLDRLVVGVSDAPPAELTEAGLSWLRNRYGALSSQSVRKGIPGLYLARPRGRRGVRNEDEVVTILRDRGFEVLDPSLSLGETIQRIRDSEFVVGAHGAAFNNVIHAKSSATIVEFCPSNRPNRCFYNRPVDVAQYHFVHSPPGKNFEISIDVEVLEKLLNGAAPRSKNRIENQS